MSASPNRTPRTPNLSALPDMNKGLSKVRSQPWRKKMRSIFKVSNAGVALWTLSPFAALAWAGGQAFVPVALMSLMSAAICYFVDVMSMHMAVGRLTAELVQDLVSADPHSRDAVLDCLTKAEKDWCMSELPRAAAELRHRYRQPSTGKCASVTWRWRLRILDQLS